MAKLSSRFCCNSELINSLMKACFLDVPWAVYVNFRKQNCVSVFFKIDSIATPYYSLALMHLIGFQWDGSLRCKVSAKLQNLRDAYSYFYETRSLGMIQAGKMCWTEITRRVFFFFVICTRSSQRQHSSTTIGPRNYWKTNGTITINCFKSMGLN